MRKKYILRKMTKIWVVGITLSSNFISFSQVAKAEDPAPASNTEAAVPVNSVEAIKYRMDTVPGEYFIVLPGDTLWNISKATIGEYDPQKFAKLNGLELNGDERNLRTNVPLARSEAEAKVISLGLPEEQRIALATRAANSLIEYDTIEEAKKAVKGASSVKDTIKKASSAASSAAYDDTYLVYNQHGRSQTDIQTDVTKTLDQVDGQLKEKKVSSSVRRKVATGLAGRTAAVASKQPISNTTQKEIAKVVTTNIVKEKKSAATALESTEVKVPAMVNGAAAQPSKITEAAAQTPAANVAKLKSSTAGGANVGISIQNKKKEKAAKENKKKAKVAAAKKASAAKKAEEEAAKKAEDLLAQNMVDLLSETSNPAKTTVAPAAQPEPVQAPAQPVVQPAPEPVAPAVEAVTSEPVASPTPQPEPAPTPTTQAEPANAAAPVVQENANAQIATDASKKTVTASVAKDLHAENQAKPVVDNNSYITFIIANNWGTDWMEGVNIMMFYGIKGDKKKSIPDGTKFPGTEMTDKKVEDNIITYKLTIENKYFDEAAEGKIFIIFSSKNKKENRVPGSSQDVFTLTKGVSFIYDGTKGEPDNNRVSYVNN